MWKRWDIFNSLNFLLLTAQDCFFQEGSDIVGEVTWVTLVTVAPDKQVDKKSNDLGEARY